MVGFNNIQQRLGQPHLRFSSTHHRRGTLTCGPRCAVVNAPEGDIQQKFKRGKDSRQIEAPDTTTPSARLSIWLLDTIGTVFDKMIAPSLEESPLQTITDSGKACRRWTRSPQHGCRTLVVSSYFSNRVLVLDSTQSSDNGQSATRLCPWTAVREHHVQWCSKACSSGEHRDRGADSGHN